MQTIKVEEIEVGQLDAVQGGQDLYSAWLGASAAAMKPWAPYATQALRASAAMGNPFAAAYLRTLTVGALGG